MPPRVGHQRPLGSVTASQRFEWEEANPPEIGDVAIETPYEGGDPEACRRAFLVVGVEETASRQRPYRIVFERGEYDRQPESGRREWSFYSIPRDRPPR